MIPRHNDPTKKNPRRDAVAPYNFVPLPEAVATAPEPLPPHDRFDPDLLTGTLACALTTASPLYVRAAQTLEEFANKTVPSAPYYGREKTDLRIPGSSLRGMLRTMVEIISYGRLAPVSRRRLFFRTVDDTSVGLAYRERMLPDKVLGGFFHQDRKGAWIEPAVVGRVDRSLLREKFGEDLHEREFPKAKLQHKRVYVRLHESAEDDPAKVRDVAEFSMTPDSGLEEATLVITGDLPVKPGEEPKKRREFVFVRRDTGVRPEIDDEMLADAFLGEDQLTQYQKKAFPKGKGRTRDGWLANGDPVFYLPTPDGTGVEFFGRGYMFRLPYTHTPEQMLPAILRDPTGYDIAEAMFGLVDAGKTGRPAVAGRVFVTDARLVGDPKKALLSDEPITLKVLSSPKPTAIQHYLTQRFPDYSDVLDHYDSDPVRESTLRGHKLYWHQGDVPRKSFEANPADVAKHRSQYSPPVKPVRSGQTFKFDIHFDNLRPAELGALLWILDKAKAPEYRLKLGMGKPYGLGSVAIDAKCRLIDRRQRYAGLFGEDGWNQGAMSQAEEEARVRDAKRAFEGLLLDHLAINPRRAKQKIEELERIRELLALLSWPGPDTSATRYMSLPEFAGRKASGFGRRAVLPTPMRVKSGELPASSPAPSRELTERLKAKSRAGAREESVGPKSRVGAPTPVTGRKSRSSAEFVLPEPPKSEAEVSDSAKELADLVKKRATEAEKREAERKKRKEEKKRKGKR